MLYTDMEGCDEIAIEQVLDFGHHPKIIDFESNKLTPEDKGDKLIERLRSEGYTVFHLGGIQSNALYPYAGYDLMAIRNDVLEALPADYAAPVSRLIVDEVRRLRRQGRILDTLDWRSYARFIVARILATFGRARP